MTTKLSESDRDQDIHNSDTKAADKKDNLTLDDDSETGEDGDITYFEKEEIEREKDFYLGILLSADSRKKLSPRIIQPPSGSIILMSKEQHRRSDPSYTLLSPEEIMGSMRTDGYRWGSYLGSHKSQKTGMRKSTVCIAGATKEDRIFRRLEFSFDGGDLLLFHYLGDSEEAKNISANTPHGNSTKCEKGYLRTDPAVLYELKHKSIETPRINVMKTYDEAVNKGRPALQTPRNLKQVQNVVESERRKKRMGTDFLYNLLKLQQNLKFSSYNVPFISTECKIIRLVVPMFVEPLIMELRRAYGISKKPIMIHYDTQFNVGNQYVSSITFTHPLFKGNSIIPLGYLIHENRYQADHESFVKEIFMNFPFLNKIPLVCVSDSEFDLSRWIDTIDQVHCWLHLKKNIESKLIYKLFVKNHGSVMNIFEQMMFIDNEVDFDEAWRVFKLNETTVLSTAIVDYFENKVIPRFKKYSAVWRLKELGVPNSERGVTSNSAESWNSVISKMWEEGMTMDQLLCTLYFLSVFYINEVVRGYHQLGKYELQSDFQSLKKPIAQLPQLDKVPPVGEIAQYVLNSASFDIYNKEDSETELENNVPCQEEDRLQSVARLLIKNGKVSTIAYGVVVVRANDCTASVTIDTDSKGRCVIQCSCPARDYCIHEEAARLYLNVKNIDSKKNSGLLKNKIRMRNKQQPGKKHWKVPKNISIPSSADPSNSITDGMNYEQVEIKREKHKDQKKKNVNDSLMRKIGAEQNVEHVENVVIGDDDEVRDPVDPGCYPLDFYLKMKQRRDILLVPNITTMKNPLKPEPSRITVFCTSENEVACAKVIQNKKVHVWTTSESTKRLSYLASFVCERKGMKKITVKTKILKPTDGEEGPYSTIARFLKDHKNIQNEDDMESQTYRYRIYCRSHCSKPFIDESDLADYTEIGTGNELVQCDQCSEWIYLECAGITASDAENIKPFVCWSCFQVKEMPKSGSKFVTMSCQVDSVTAIIAGVWAQNCNTKRYILEGKKEEVDVALGIMMILDGDMRSGQQQIHNMCIKSNGKLIKKNNIYDFFGGENILLDPLRHVFSTSQVVTCTNEACPKEDPRVVYEHYVLTPADELKTEDQWRDAIEDIFCVKIENCQKKADRRSSTKCIGEKVTSSACFISDRPWFLPIDVVATGAKYHDVFKLPKEIKVAGKKFKLAGATLFLSAHFKAIINYQNRWFMADNMNGRIDSIDDEAKPLLKEWVIGNIYYFLV